MDVTSFILSYFKEVLLIAVRFTRSSPCPRKSDATATP